MNTVNTFQDWKLAQTLEPKGSLKSLSRLVLIKQIQRRYHSEFNHLFKYYVLGKRGSKVLHSIKKLRVLTVNLLKLLYLQEHQLTNQDYDPKAIPTTNASQIPLPNILNTICCKFVQTPSTLHKISLPYTSSKIALQTEIRPP